MWSVSKISIPCISKNNLEFLCIFNVDIFYCEYLTQIPREANLCNIQKSDILDYK